MTRVLKLCLCGVFLFMSREGRQFGGDSGRLSIGTAKDLCYTDMSMEIHGYGHELARVFWIAVNSPDINHDLSEKQNIGLLDEHVCGCRDSESREMSRRVKNNEGGLQGFGDVKFVISASNKNKVRYKTRHDAFINTRF